MQASSGRLPLLHSDVLAPCSVQDFWPLLVSTGNVPFSLLDWKTVHHLSTEGVDNMLGRTHCSCLAISTSSCSPFSETGGACSSTEIVSKHTTRREFLSVPPARACAGADDKVNAVHPTILSPSFLGAPHLSAALHFPHHVCRIDGCVPRIGWLYYDACDRPTRFFVRRQ